MAKSAKAVSVFSEDLAVARLELVALKERIATLVRCVAFDKSVAVNAKAVAAQARIDAAVEKAQEKLDKALARTVKSPAQKKRAARRAGPVVSVLTEGQEANLIAMRFAAAKLQKELF